MKFLKALALSLVVSIALAQSAHAAPSPQVDLLTFGAKCDGTTDDTAAIQKALSSGASRVHIPAATCLTGALTMSSNTELYGDGPNVSILKAKNSTNTDLITVSAKSFVSFKSFRIEGNSANQTQGNAIKVAGSSTDIVCENVLVNDHYDWAYSFNLVTRVRVNGCGATNGRAGANLNAVRGGFLLGDSIGPNAANDVEITNCFISSSNAFVNGVMSEVGNNHRIIGCRTAVAYTGYKIKGSNVIVSGNYASGGVQGYQTQTSSRNLVFTGNIAYRAGDSGFLFAQVDTGNPLIGLLVNGNMAIECGQAPTATSYGFAFEPSASATIDQVVLTNNIAIDNQGVKTQARGFSFGIAGTVSNVLFSENFSKGNTADIVLGVALQKASTTFGWNPGLVGASTYPGSYPTSVSRMDFWTNNLPQSSGTVVCLDGLGARGYQVPRAGYIRSLAVTSSAPVTAGNATFQLRVNGAIDSSFNTQLNVTNPSFNITSVNVQTRTLAAGDMITVIATGDGALLPNGTDNFDVVVEIAY